MYTFQNKYIDYDKIWAHYEFQTLGCFLRHFDLERPTIYIQVSSSSDFSCRSGLSEDSESILFNVEFNAVSHSLGIALLSHIQTFLFARCIR